VGVGKEKGRKGAFGRQKGFIPSERGKRKNWGNQDRDRMCSGKPPTVSLLEGDEKKVAGGKGRGRPVWVGWKPVEGGKEMEYKKRGPIFRQKWGRRSEA